MVLLYGASATYHSINAGGRILRVFRKIDHMMIFVLIAGSYTPICLVVLGGKLGYTLLAVVWGVAILGMTIKAVWITCPKWFSSVIYIATVSYTHLDVYKRQITASFSCGYGFFVYYALFFINVIFFFIIINYTFTTCS